MLNHTVGDQSKSTLVFEAAEAVLAKAGLLGKRILVAVSGGVDSVCLLGVLHRIFRGSGALEVAHVNHGLRPGSEEDAAFCRELAGGLGLPFHLRRLSSADFPPGKGLQAEARRCRRAFLREVAADRGMDAVALGHHSDDQVETVLFRLLRGVGPRGAAGMAPWDPPFVRPILHVSKVDLQSLAREEGWPHREDPSNRSLRFSRNRIRHQVLPVMRSVNPAVDSAVLRFAELVAEDDAFLTGLTGIEMARLGTREPEGVRFPSDALRRLAASIRRRLYLAAWSELGCDPSVLELRHLEAVDGLLGPGRPHRHAPVPGPGVFARSYGDLWVLRPGLLPVPIFQITLRGQGRVALPELGLAAAWGSEPPPRGSCVGIPSGRPAGTLALRTWRPGDRVTLSGRTPFKVKDALMEARVPAWRRAAAMVAEDEEGPFGILLSDRAWGGAPGEQGCLWLEPLEQGDR